MQLKSLTLSILIGGFVFGAGLISSVQAVEPLTLKELNFLCKDYNAHPEQSESKQCARYIKGFIDGAIAADTGVKTDQSDEVGANNSFTDRVINTRIGSRLKRDGSSESSQFCLGNPVLIADVIGTVTEKIKTIKNHEQSALRAMFKILKDNYSCSTKS